MNPHWSQQYLQRPWVAGGRGPKEFDCWGIVRWCSKQHYGHDLPLHPIPPHSAEATRTIDAAAHSPEWIKLAGPSDGAVVGLSQHRIFHHVGLYINEDKGVVIHCADKIGVIIHRVESLPSRGWNRVEYFWHKSWL